MAQKLFRLGAFISAVVIFSGCASLDSSGYRQSVLLRSAPAGAKILENDVEIGQTPAYVGIRRRRHPEVKLLFPNGESKSVALKTKYRWGDSFASNFLFLSLAPVGWGTDLLTGTAWHIEDPPDSVQAGEKSDVKARLRLVAVAPPIASDPVTADALGPLIEMKLRELGGFQVLNYEATAPLFSYFNSDNGISDRTVENHGLYRELKADHIFLSDVKPKDAGFLVSGRFRDVYSGQETGHFSWEITPSESDLKERLGIHEFFAGRFHFLPNTLFLNFSSFQPGLIIDGISRDGTSEIGHEWYDRTLNYVSFLSLAHLQRPRKDVRAHWTFDFVPTLNFSHKKISFENYPPLNGSRFDRWYINGGYGVELGYLSRFGLAYFDYIPSLAWSRIRASGPQPDEDFQSLTVVSTIEFGYSYFISPHFIAKLFTRGFSEDSSLWQKAVRSQSQGTEQISYSGFSLVGIALGYYIPSSFDSHDKWRISNRNGINRAGGSP